MNFNRYFAKHSFWSQLFFGIVAVFALPAVSQATLENEAETSLNRSVEQAVYENVVAYGEQAVVACLAEITPTEKRQAVSFCHFSAKIDRLPLSSLPPIRAGPLA